MILFKNIKDRLTFYNLHPVLIMIYADLFWYAYREHNIRLVITQTISSLIQDKILKRVSKSHRFKCAIDIRTKGINAFIIKDMCDYINNKEAYKDYRYLRNNGDRILALYHIGNEEHIHLAIHARFFIK